MAHADRLTGPVPPLRAAGLCLALSIGAAAASHAVVTGQCVQARGGNSCTANDVTFIVVGLGVQDDGCVNGSDTLTIRMGALLQNTSAGTRYDVGMYVYNSLGADPPATSQGFAYNGSSCARESLKPAGTLNDLACTYDSPAGSLNLGDGDGPFLNTDGDSCGDLLKVQTSSTCDADANGLWDDSFMIFTDPITIRCADGTNGAADGFADIPTCATWGQNANDIGTGGVCSSETDVLPGTPSKCNCQNVNSTVPQPSLALSCSCSPTTVRTGASNGASAACTVTFTNGASCSPDAGTEERFRCGAASFLQFDTVASTPSGSYVFGYQSGAGDAATESTGGDVFQPSASTVRWTPRDSLATGGGTTLGVIGQSQTGTLTFDYFVDPSTPSGTTIPITTTAYWSNSGTLDGTDHTLASRVAQSALTTTCTLTASDAATWARVSGFAARRENGQVVVEWETAGEVGTRAFLVERRNPATGVFETVTERPVPAIAQIPGGRYRLVDPGAGAGDAFVYRLVELDSQGASEVQGPYPVKVRPERSPRAARRAFTAADKQVSPRLLEAAAAREVGRQRPLAAAASAGGGATGLAKLAVGASGMVHVPASELAAALGASTAQVAAQVKAGRLLLTRGGSPVAWQPAADGDGIDFYALGLHNQYTDIDVYRLELATGLRMTTVPAAMSGLTADPSFADTLHFERDLVPGTAASLPVEDFWVWKSFFPGFPGFDRGTFAAEVPAPAAGPATLSVNVYGFAAQQRAEVRVNGTGLGEIVWSGRGAASLALTVPGGVLRDGDNAIEVVALQADQGFWLDSFDLSYPHLFRAAGERLAFRATGGQSLALAGFGSPDVAVYDLAEPLAPRQLGGLAPRLLDDGTWGVSFSAPRAGAYLALTRAAVGGVTATASAPVDLRQPPGGGAEYLVLAPRELLAEGQRLADLRAAQGLSALAVDLGDVMDGFAHGAYDPPAIRRFLAHAVGSWGTPPRYVALAGKGTYDYRDVFGLGSNLVPTLFVATEDGVAAADASLADLDGTGLPAVALGRIPAVTAEELGAYVDKLAAYEAGDGGAWARSALLVADDADLAGDFAATSEGLASRLAPSFTATRLYLPGGADPSRVQASRAELQAALRAGQGLFNYVGHGGLDRLATEGLLLTGDVAGLGNGARLPVVTALTCLVAQFAYPSVSSLGEELVLQPDGGAAAVFGPTWLSHNGAAGELGRHLLPELSDAGEERLGDRVLRGLAAYAAAGGDPELLRLYTLLGDPAILSPR